MYVKVAEAGSPRKAVAFLAVEEEADLEEAKVAEAGSPPLQPLFPCDAGRSGVEALNAARGLSYATSHTCAELEPNRGYERTRQLAAGKPDVANHL